VTDAYCNPKPLQKRPRIWLGGGGEKRFLRMVARHADAWNVPFIGPDVYAEKNRILDDGVRGAPRPEELLRTSTSGSRCRATKRRRREARRLEEAIRRIPADAEPGC